MKSILLLMVAGLVCLGVAGCDDDDDESTSAQATTNDIPPQASPSTSNNQDIPPQASPATSNNEGNPPAGPLGGTYGALNVSGKWLGWYELGGVKNLLSLQLSQNGPLVGGTYTFGDGASGLIASGQIHEDILMLVFERNGAAFQMQGRVDQSAPSYIGDWEDDGRNNSGTFSLR